MITMIEVSGLCKRYGVTEAVRDLSFSVKKGERFALLGSNGAGKSTTISILCGCLLKDSGKVFIENEDIDKDFFKIKNELGVVFQSSVLDKALSVRDNLKIRAALYGISGKKFRERLSELSKLLEFEKMLYVPVGRLSGGQRRKIDIARALIHQPKVLILDEPTAGLDPQTRKDVWNTTKRLSNSEGLTVLFTTHYMEEAEKSDYVFILNNGKKAACGTPEQLKEKYSGDRITLYGVSEQIVAKLGYPYESFKNGCYIIVPNTEKATEIILKHPTLFKNYEITKGKMDDVFLALTGKNRAEVMKNESTENSCFS